MRLISEYWDWRLVQLGRTLPLQSGWRVASPPPKGLAFWTLVGIPFANTTFNNPNDMGIFVQFHRDRWSTQTETRPIMDVFWEAPPGMECGGFRQFTVSEEKYFHQVLSGHANLAIDVSVPRQRILKQACDDFHKRHPHDGERLQRVELWYVTQTVEDPWRKQLSKPHHSFVTAAVCETVRLPEAGGGKLGL